ncbi:MULTISPECIES: GntR family transcriptional regulator [Sphingomonas]|jgi:GntR family transcriptional regulator|uniref:GntR family transcriptional regulator n=1 Tax=Sphingomonas aerolata TaxID=185951 RepID=A0A2T4YM73_9SPHN|nr:MULTISPECIES: GntR family transcriptional regulator [Sphingomonas]RZM32457.1 MAG: GntR family transcriptional regulator [Sphingomonas sp.]KQM91687.1 GntR family transcriptional regulator [Sphingomonas sp. Leaf226]KQN21011.1 GntR family transcriptional regulator [Sphingomonas sp. Leaf30]MBB3586184.1 GntR family transcriptional regulator [Sphingomonas sp. BK481]MBD8470962.1 GntR family transcriptional regulator [Sphingomonas sp. CFBP 8765]
MAFSDDIGRFRKGNPSPLYLQLQDLIRNAIGEKLLVQGNAIPAERDLAIEYDVSRITVRKAIGGLVEEGLLTRRRGAGTFVAGRVEKSFSKLSSFSEDMAARGRTSSSTWISRSAGQVNPEEAMALGLSPGAPVFRFNRIRYADEEAMALEFSTIAGYCLTSVDGVTDSLYAALEAAGSRPVRALQRLRAVPFGGEHARMLGVDAGHAGLLIERRGFLRDGRAAEFTRSYYRGDAYDFVAELADI